jgi:hypothetical protein
MPSKSSAFLGGAVVGIIATLLFIVLAREWNDLGDSPIEFRNSSDARLCYVEFDGCDEIKPNAISHYDWNGDSCTGASRVTITTWEGEEVVYSRLIDCDRLGDAHFIISERDGELLILDDAHSRPVP